MNLQEVVPRASRRQFEEVEANGPPRTRGNRKGHQQPGWGPMLRLDALAGGATPDEGVDVGQQRGPPHGATSQRERLVAAEVPPQRGGVKLRQHEAAQRRVSRDAQAVAALAAHCTDPPLEIAESLCRDVLNLALGNKDNHARNTAICRQFDGRIALTPLYDFVPMLLHPDGIARRCRWDGEGVAGPVWHEVVARLAARHGLDATVLAARLAALLPGLRELAAHGIELGIEGSLLERLRPAINAQCAALALLDI